MISGLLNLNMGFVLPLLASIFGIGFLIMIHEFGHFIFCKYFKIPVLKFAIGIGPKLFSKKIGETSFSVGIVPLAGYVQIGNDENKYDEEVDLLLKRPIHHGILMSFGGIILNVFFAYFSLCCFSIFYNDQSNYMLRAFYPHNKVSNLINENNIIKNDDILLYCNGSRIGCPHDFYNSCLEIKDNKIEIVVLRNNEKSLISFDADLNKFNYREIYFSDSENNNSFLKRVKNGFIITNNIIKATIYGIISIFSGKNINKITGFLGILRAGSSVSKTGFANFIIFLAIVSINLAIANLIPIPALDGGQVLMLVLSKIFGKYFPENVQRYILYLGFSFLILIMIYSTYNDLISFIF